MTNEYRRSEHTPIPGIRIFARRQAQAGRACGGLLTSGAMVPRAIALAVSPKRPIDSGVIHDPANAEMPFSLQGQLLIASPTLADGTFDHSVIYLHQHSSTTGAVGAILNHRTETKVGDLLPEAEFKALHKLPVHHGGPLATDELTFSSFSWHQSKGFRCRPRISAEAASKIIGLSGQVVRAMIGHSAWSPGQLENELTHQTWITLRPTHDLMTLAHDLTLWNALLKSISPYHCLLSEAPQNPFLN